VTDAQKKPQHEPKVRAVLDFYKAIFEELDPEKLRSTFLRSLLVLQNVERGSLWIKREDHYACVEATGVDSDKIRTLSLPVDTPSIVGWVIEHGEMTVAEPGKDERHYAAAEAEVTEKSRLILCFPLILKNGQVYGAVELIDTSAAGDQLNLNADYLTLLEAQVAIGGLALSNSLAYSNQVLENVRLKRVLQELREETPPIIGQSKGIETVLKSVNDYARTDFPVLITGESGTGKELMAHEIHRLSRRRGKPFLVQNCSAIPETLLESELFGYKKGAFTGANQDKVGLFEAAHGGTVFLDEIGDMPLNLQARILRVLQNNEIKPLGGSTTKTVDVRILSATNRNLQEAIAAQQFREDLFYRLNVLPLRMPPLRERSEDIPLLLDYFLKREARRLDIRPPLFTEKALHRLIEHPWHGNIREMENLVKYILTTVNASRIGEADLPAHLLLSTPLGHPLPAPAHEPEAIAPPRSQGLAEYSWDELEHAYVLALLEKYKWNVTRTAQAAKVNRSTFDSRMKKLGIGKS
jgi:transcriptional regulator with GAF, ATPase, and Fis domain